LPLCGVFFQPQFKRCGALTHEVMDELRKQVSFKLEWASKLPSGTTFFQTLPRDKTHPLVPLQFDSSPLNGWDRVANNAYFLHVVLLSMLFGRIGRGLPSANAKVVEGEPELELRLQCPLSLAAQGAKMPSFVEIVDISDREKTRRPERAQSAGAIPLENGLVIDHIGLGPDASTCWQVLQRVRTILGWASHDGSEGVYDSKRKGGFFKAIMSLPSFNYELITVPQLKVLASIAPGCTVNAITDSKVIRKFRLHVPSRIYNLPNIHCRRAICVANPKNQQRDVVTFFERVPFYETSAIPNCKESEYLFVCKYCRWPHQYEEIWADDAGKHSASLDV